MGYVSSLVFGAITVSIPCFSTCLFLEKSEKVPDPVDIDIRGIYSTQQDFGMTLRGAGGRLQNFSENNNPNNLTQKQEMLARSAIKYWVERHKHVVRYVAKVLQKERFNFDRNSRRLMPVCHGILWMRPLLSRWSLELHGS